MLYCQRQRILNTRRSLNNVEMAQQEKDLKNRPGVIAIDGQVAAGKTAVGRELASRLGCPFLDTGIMYRAITWLALQREVATDDAAGLGELAQRAVLQLRDLEGRSILLGDRELGPELRSAKVDGHVSLVAQVSGVRREMVRQQRDIASLASRNQGGIVMVGRDIGTVVLPDANLKVFMIASPEVRARRRYDELLAQGQPADYDQILANALTRDRIDSQRADSPLAQAADALLVDTSELSIEQVVNDILERLRAGAGRNTP